MILSTSGTIATPSRTSGQETTSRQTTTLQHLKRGHRIWARLSPCYGRTGVGRDPSSGVQGRDQAPSALRELLRRMSTRPDCSTSSNDTCSLPRATKLTLRYLSPSCCRAWSRLARKVTMLEWSAPRVAWPISRGALMVGTGAGQIAEVDEHGAEVAEVCQGARFREPRSSLSSWRQARHCRRATGLRVLVEGRRGHDLITGPQSGRPGATV